MIDLETVKAWARVEIDAVPEGESFIYKGELRDASPYGVNCMYYENGEPSCLIGRMLDRNNLITPERVASLEVNHDDAESLIASYLPGHFSAQAKRFMFELQARQDEGMTWGLAYEEALNGL
jgi:hypothetical protein